MPMRFRVLVFPRNMIHNSINVIEFIFEMYIAITATRQDCCASHFEKKNPIRVVWYCCITRRKFIIVEHGHMAEL